MQVVARYRPVVVAVTMLSLMLAGCGQKGPLYRDAGAQAGYASEAQPQAPR
ncbi:LPS translocon maturation chaperone LptM [Marinobacter persicus]|uniref:Lipoprotein n=1 Tax=Marinobacter persicus TaxID=930118 RepID=A0A2S6G6N8_9GAMM|nr:lipoprotein [Marinobacter persicus]KXS53933.1 MAG: hypothetical protein AWU57_1685 [Marinobacter sp. T13-3]PPK51408.1 putative lipoprotein [Marinobacter persicus]PPK54812.1 putative lipoprotein [Marinobacter persicus]PPK58095.1 putative lipoprotein [Marinobacter persicus]